MISPYCFLFILKENGLFVHRKRRVSTNRKPSQLLSIRPHFHFTAIFSVTQFPSRPHPPPDLLVVKGVFTIGSRLVPNRFFIHRPHGDLRHLSVTLSHPTRQFVHQRLIDAGELKLLSILLHFPSLPLQQCL